MYLNSTNLLKRTEEFKMKLWRLSPKICRSSWDTRRIKGVHTITAEEYGMLSKYPDSISRMAYPIDISCGRCGNRAWSSLKKRRMYLIAPIAEDFPNLSAGRCISAIWLPLRHFFAQAKLYGVGCRRSSSRTMYKGRWTVPKAGILTISWGTRN